MDKRSPSSFKAAFLTDNVKLTEESADVKARRADSVQEALQPVFSIFHQLQEDCKALDTEVQSEIFLAFKAMKQAAERKYQASAKKLLQAQRRLEELEEEFEREDAVVTVKREIELYSDKAEKMEKQFTQLKEQHHRFKTNSEELAAEIHEKGAILNTISRENISFHRSISSVHLPKPPTLPSFPLMNLFESVPFEVFTELSARDVGFLSITQIQTFIKYKKHLEGVKAQLDQARMQTQFQRLASFGDRGRVRLEDVFAQCVTACRDMSGGYVKNQSFSASLGERFVPFATISDFRTVYSSRLYDIAKVQEGVARRKRRPMPLYSRKDLDSLPANYLLRLLLERKECIDRLQFFITHPNPFRSSIEGERDKEFSSLLEVD